MLLSNVPISAIRAFEAAARTGSFRDAANELHLTPSAVSHAIRKLENTMSTTLFERSARAVRLTPAGKNLMRHAGAAFDNLRRGIEEVAGRGPNCLGCIARQASPRNGWRRDSDSFSPPSRNWRSARRQHRICTIQQRRFRYRCRLRSATRRRKRDRSAWRGNRHPALRSRNRKEGIASRGTCSTRYSFVQRSSGNSGTNSSRPMVPNRLQFTVCVRPRLPCDRDGLERSRRDTRVDAACRARDRDGQAGRPTCGPFGRRPLRRPNLVFPRTSRQRHAVRAFAEWITSGAFRDRGQVQKTQCGRSLTSLVVARNRHVDAVAACPQLPDKRTWLGRSLTSEKMMRRRRRSKFYSAGWAASAVADMGRLCRALGEMLIPGIRAE